MSDSDPSQTPPAQRPDYGEESNVSRLHDAIRREKQEPAEGSEPLPVQGFVFVAVILAAGFMYLGMYSGGFSGDVYDERSGSAGGVAADAGAAEEVDPAVAMMNLGKRTFTTYCQSCHQQSGLGVAGVYPPLVGSEWVLGSPKLPTLIVLHGLQGPIEVKGVVYNQVMQQWGAALSDKEIAAVVSYIRNEWGNAAAMIDADYVTALRDEFSDRSKAWSADELLALPE
jgi:mono/diheme cytochrome c family protein